MTGFQCPIPIALGDTVFLPYIQNIDGTLIFVFINCGLPKDPGDLPIVVSAPMSVGNPMVTLPGERFIRTNRGFWNPVRPQACANSATALSRMPMLCSAIFRSCAA